MNKCKLCEIHTNELKEGYCLPCYDRFIINEYPVLTTNESNIITANGYNFESFMIEHKEKVIRQFIDEREQYNV